MQPDLRQIDSEEWNKGQGQAVLRTWEVESPHNYENNQDVSMVYGTLCLLFSYCTSRSRLLVRVSRALCCLCLVFVFVFLTLISAIYGRHSAARDAANFRSNLTSGAKQREGNTQELSARVCCGSCQNAAVSLSGPEIRVAWKWLKNNISKPQRFSTLLPKSCKQHCSIRSISCSDMISWSSLTQMETRDALIRKLAPTSGPRWDS